jgi:hypothetical protein
MAGSARPTGATTVNVSMTGAGARIGASSARPRLTGAPATLDPARQ